jgi:DNA-binding LacI/PurR family transcriptional regulator
MAPPPKKRKSNSDRVSIGDIARYCNVGISTVSRVLNDRLDEFPVSEAMVERVRNAAQQLGYRPNRLARAVRSQRTNLIGLSFIHIDHQKRHDDQVAYENQVLGELANIILSHRGFKNYNLVLHDRDEEQTSLLRERDFETDLLDGMIYLTPSEKHMEFLDIASPTFPIVLLGHTPGAEKKVPCVDINNRNASRKAVKHLIQTGRKKILFLIPEKLHHLCCIQERLLGYKDELAENKIPLSKEFIRTVRCLPEAVYEFLKELRCLDEIDAIFCPQDELSALCLRSLQEMGKRIPEDIAIIGFDDTSIAEHTSPPLSSVRLPLAEQVHAATDLLLKIMNKEIPYEPGFHEIETTLVIRESTVKQQA